MMIKIQYRCVLTSSLAWLSSWYFQHDPSNPERMGLNKFVELKLAW